MDDEPTVRDVLGAPRRPTPEADRAREVAERMTPAAQPVSGWESVMPTVEDEERYRATLRARGTVAEPTPLFRLGENGANPPYIPTPMPGELDGVDNSLILPGPDAREQPGFEPAPEGYVYDFSNEPLDPNDLFEPLGAFLHRVANDPAPTYLVDRVVVANGLCIIGGGPKGGKSLFAINLGMAVACGQPAFDLPTERAMFVYITEEGAKHGTAQRFSRLLATYPAAEGQVRVVYRQRVAITDEWVGRLDGRLTALGSRPVLLCLDPLRNLLPPGVSENEQGAMQTVIGRLHDLKAAHEGLTLLLVHHLRKPQRGAKLTGTELSGSGAIYAAADSTVIWQADKAFGADSDPEDEESGEESSDFIHIGPAEPLAGRMTVESKDDEPWKARWELDPGTGLFSRANGAARRGPRVNPTLERVTAALTDDYQSIAVIAAKVYGLKSRGNAGHITAIRPFLDALHEDGLVDFGGHISGYRLGTIQRDRTATTTATGLFDSTATTTATAGDDQLTILDEEHE